MNPKLHYFFVAKEVDHLFKFEQEMFCGVFPVMSSVLFGDNLICNFKIVRNI